MDKILLLSVIAAMIVLPSFFAKDPRNRRGLRNTTIALFVFNVFYVFGLIYVLPRILA